MPLRHQLYHKAFLHKLFWSFIIPMAIPIPLRNFLFSMKILHFTRPNSGSTVDCGSNIWSQCEKDSPASVEFHNFISPAGLLRDEEKQYKKGWGKESLCTFSYSCVHFKTKASCNNVNMGSQAIRTLHISEATKKKTQQKYQPLTKHICLKQSQVSSSACTI